MCDQNKTTGILLVCVFILLLIFGIPIATIYYGAKYAAECPLDPIIPTYTVVLGVSFILVYTSLILLCTLLCKEDYKPCSLRCIQIFPALAVLFMSIWTIYGLILRTTTKGRSGDKSSDHFCNYKIWATFTATVITACCIAGILAVLGAWAWYDYYFKSCRDSYCSCIAGNNGHAAMSSSISILSPPDVPTTSAHPDKGCRHYSLCARVKSNLPGPISKTYFDKKSKFNQCYCEHCIQTRKESEFNSVGNPPQTYTLPIGWARFGLVVPQHTTEDNIWKDYNVAYHGTRMEAVKQILDAGGLLLPAAGDYWRKKLGLKARQIFLSPSMKYCSREAYANLQILTLKDGNTQTKIQFRVAFETRIRPGSFTTGRANIKEEVDKYIPNSEIEWLTEDRNAVVTTALLIRIENYSELVTADAVV